MQESHSAHSPTSTKTSMDLNQFNSLTGAKIQNLPLPFVPPAQGKMRRMRNFNCQFTETR